MKSIAVALIFYCSALTVNAKTFRMSPATTVAQLGQYPHQVSLQFTGVHICGGALITTSHVLTAAHCIFELLTGIPVNANQTVPKTPLNQVTVEVGSVWIGYGQSHAIKRFSFPRDYNNNHPTSYSPHDIAVLTLSVPVTLSAYVNTIALPEPMSELAVGSVVTVSGFGQGVPGGPMSPFLKHLGQWVMDPAACSNFFLSHPNSGRSVLSTNICAYAVEGIAVCGGDSGSPLIQNGRVVGVVSGGLGICDGKSPDIYTKVSYYLPYIKYEIEFNRVTYDTYCNDAYYKNIFAAYCTGTAAAYNV